MLLSPACPGSVIVGASQNALQFIESRSLWGILRGLRSDSGSCHESAVDPTCWGDFPCLPDVRILHWCPPLMSKLARSAPMSRRLPAHCHPSRFGNLDEFSLLFCLPIQFGGRTIAPGKGGPGKSPVRSTLQLDHLPTDRGQVTESNSAQLQNFRTSPSMCTQVCPDYPVILFPLIRIGICAIPALTGTRPTSQSI